MSNKNRITWSEWREIQEAQRATPLTGQALRDEFNRWWQTPYYKALAEANAAYREQQAALAPYHQAIEECYEGDLTQLAERLAEVARRFPECPKPKPYSTQ